MIRKFVIALIAVMAQALVQLSPFEPFGQSVQDYVDEQIADNDFSGTVQDVTQ